MLYVGEHSWAAWLRHLPKGALSRAQEATASVHPSATESVHPKCITAHPHASKYEREFREALQRHGLAYTPEETCGSSAIDVEIDWANSFLNCRSRDFQDRCAYQENMATPSRGVISKLLVSKFPRMKR